MFYMFYCNIRLALTRGILADPVINACTMDWLLDGQISNIRNYNQESTKFLGDCSIREAGCSNNYLNSAFLAYVDLYSYQSAEAFHCSNSFYISFCPSHKLSSINTPLLPDPHLSKIENDCSLEYFECRKYVLLE